MSHSNSVIWGGGGLFLQDHQIVFARKTLGIRYNIFLHSICRTYHLRADSPAEAESWLSALRHTQVSGIPLAEQQLTSTGIPILIHKCLQFVESYGMETEGLYRLSGQKANIRKLILAFNQGAHTHTCTIYTMYLDVEL